MEMAAGRNTPTVFYISRALVAIPSAASAFRAEIPRRALAQMSFAFVICL